MDKKLAIVIAVEKYTDKRIPAVKYAEDDAKGFAAALGLGGALDKVFLLSAKATKTTINSQVRQHVKALTAADQFYMFYAGHGFSKNGHNFITCHDTDLDDLEDTSINLKELLDVCGKSACKHIALFLDSCESGITDLPEIRGIYATMSEKELTEFFKAAEYMTCFASCKTSESSYSADVLRHGVWTHQVIQALEGNERLALEGGRYVTATSLQNYLTSAIPRTLRHVFTKPTVQTPWAYGSQSGDFVISDLENILKLRSVVKPGYEQVKRVFLRLEETVRIVSLSGFAKGRHRVPTDNNSATNKFVQSISEEEVHEETEQIFARIRDHMGYKRRDLTSDNGHIMTPDFEFWVECTQDSEDPAMAIISRRLTNISPKVVLDDSFNDAFDDYFNDLSFEFSNGVDIEALIDQLEDLALDKVDLSYPADCSYCKITIEGSPLDIKVTAGNLTVHTKSAVAPKLLVESFFDVQRRLAGSSVLKAITQSSTG
jgi:Caspase domain